MTANILRQKKEDLDFPHICNIVIVEDAAPTQLKCLMEVSSISLYQQQRTYSLCFSLSSETENFQLVTSVTDIIRPLYGFANLLFQVYSEYLCNVGVLVKYEAAFAAIYQEPTEAVLTDTPGLQGGWFTMLRGVRVQGLLKHE